jgi:hypothetical protein
MSLGLGGRGWEFHLTGHRKRKTRDIASFKRVRELRPLEGKRIRIM